MQMFLYMVLFPERQSVAEKKIKEIQLYCHVEKSSIFDKLKYLYSLSQTESETR